MLRVLSPTIGKLWYLRLATISAASTQQVNSATYNTLVPSLSTACRIGIMSMAAKVPIVPVPEQAFTGHQLQQPQLQVEELLEDVVQVVVVVVLVHKEHERDLEKGRKRNLTESLSRVHFAQQHGLSPPMHGQPGAQRGFAHIGFSMMKALRHFLFPHILRVVLGRQKD